MSIILRARRIVTNSPIVSGWRSYLSALERNPGRTLAINTCLLMGAGDVIAQLLLENRTGRLRMATRDNSDVQRLLHNESHFLPFDFMRTARFCLVGLTMAGPSMHVWYSALDRVFRGNGLPAVFRKTAADQLFFLPVYLAVFVGVMGALRGDRPSDIASLLRRDMVEMLTISYAIWPVVQVINFRFVPLHHRVLVINVVCLFWNTYIGWKAEKQLLPDNITASRDAIITNNVRL